MKCFKNAMCLLENRGVVKTDLFFDERIAGFDISGASAEELMLADGAVVVPGFIDEHVHGAGGADVMDAKGESLETVGKTLAAEGTTGFLATTMTQSKENIMRALAVIKEYSLTAHGGAKLWGVHLEGPFISRKYKGAQKEEYIVPPDKKLFDEFFAASGENIKIITVAPEEDGAEDFIRYISEKGVRVFAGHTDASFFDIESAIPAGLVGVTHTYNAQSPLHHREIGTVGSALLKDELCCEIIADTVHVSVPAMKLLIKSKPAEKIALITDSIRAKGLPDGESELGGNPVIVKNGEARLFDGTLAGSVLKMNVAVKNTVEKTGVPFVDAIGFATINPAKNIGIDDETGSIRKGKRADFTVLDSRFNVVLTVCGGKVIYKAY